MSSSSTAALSIQELQQEFSARTGYLNTASIGVPPRSMIELLHAELDRWARGEWTAPQFDAVVAEARRGYAELTRVPVESVAIGSAASPFVGQVVSSLPRGSEVLYAKDDFTSLLFPILERARAGELRVREVELEGLIDAIRPETTMVAVSLVQSATGEVVDAEALVQAARQNDASTLVDATQAVGWHPFDASKLDYVVTAAYKWLLSPRGVAYMSVRPERLEALRARNAGWYAGEDVWRSVYGAPLRLANSARRFDISPAWLSWVGAASVMPTLQRVGVASIGEHNVALARRFAERAGLPEPRSAIVRVPQLKAAEALRAAGFVVSERNGATRLSFHLYNTEAEADRAAAVVRSSGGG
ncbi:MAG: aminotransferase class V-fold PLP-dependent enzyme [Myxococcota bacterium]